MASVSEPCAMCTGTLYWANTGRLVYCHEEAALLELPGNHAANPTINLPSRTVLAAGQKPIEVVGPIPELREELLEPHRTFWKLPPRG
jgi:tRNA(Arg) A34 adenosine deaminase TadA